MIFTYLYNIIFFFTIDRNSDVYFCSNSPLPRGVEVLRVPASDVLERKSELDLCRQVGVCTLAIKYFDI